MLVFGGPAVGPDNPINNVVFRNCTFSKAADTTAVSRAFQTYEIGENGQSVNNIQFIGSSYLNGASSTFNFVSSGAKDVSVGWLLGVTVRGRANQPVSGATVSVINDVPSTVYTGITDANGQIAKLQVVTANYKVARGGDNTPIITTLTPHTVTASKNGITTSQSINATSNQTVALTLGASTN